MSSKRRSRPTKKATAPAEASRPARRGRPFEKGGDLRRGPGAAGRGAAGRSGRPVDWLRAQLVGCVADRIEILEAIADGVPMVPVRIPIAALLAQFGDEIAKHLGVPRAELKVKEGFELAEVEVLVSAPVRDRIRALELLLKYGIGLPPQEITGRFTGKMHATVTVRREAGRGTA